jgi:hypothetical protein
LKFRFLSLSLLFSHFYPLSLSFFSLAVLGFLILLQMANQKGKKMDFVGVGMSCWMPEVAEELRDVPF